MRDFADGSDAPGGCRIPSFTSIDLSGKWKLLPRLELSASVQNVFDRIAPLDPLTFAVTALVLTLVAAVASYVPARRGARLAPTEALRTE